MPLSVADVDGRWCIKEKSEVAMQSFGKGYWPPRFKLTHDPIKRPEKSNARVKGSK